MRKLLIVVLLVGMCVTALARQRGFIFVERRPPFSVSPPPTDFFARWEMNNDITIDYYHDFSGNGLNMTNVQSTVDRKPDWFVAGAANSSDGHITIDDFKGNYLDAGNPESLNFPTGQSFSVGVWVKVIEDSGTLPAIISKGDIGSGNVWGIYLDNASGYTLRSIIRSSAGDNILASTNITDGNWHLASFTRNIGEFSTTLYLDGVFVASNAVASTTPSNALAFRIGKSAARNELTGRVGDCMVYNSVVSSQQWLTLFSSGTLPTNTTVAHYKFSTNVARTFATLVSPEMPGGDVHLATSLEPAFTNSSHDFDGVDDYISANDENFTNDFYTTVSTALSVSVWLNADSFSLTPFPVSFASGLTTRGSLRVGGSHAAGNFEPFGLSWTVNSADATMVSTVSNVFPASFTNEWHNVVLSWDTNDAALYLDGVAQSIFTNTFEETIGTIDKFYIGKRAADGVQVWDGKIDDVTLFNRRVSADEASDIFMDGRSE